VAPLPSVTVPLEAMVPLPFQSFWRVKLEDVWDVIAVNGGVTPVQVGQ
jgi:hypothetical protein